MDPSWTSDAARTRQFNMTYNPALGTASVVFPSQVAPAPPEFSIHSFWEDPGTYGADGFTHRVYINVTFEKQTLVAPGDGAFSGPTPRPWDRNFALDDALTWDIKAMLQDSGVAEAMNASYEEFGVQRLASLSVSGSPAGSIPPGATDILSAPSLISYSSNMPCQLNVSIPDLVKDGSPGTTIPATFVDVINTHSTATNLNSDIWSWVAFSAANDNLCVWGQESGTYVGPVGNGTVSAGGWYSDLTAARRPEAFEATSVLWRVEVPAGTPEGVYRATITITLWS
jgi:hypothetical protein